MVFAVVKEDIKDIAVSIVFNLRMQVNAIASPEDDSSGVAVLVVYLPHMQIASRVVNTNSTD